MMVRDFQCGDRAARAKVQMPEMTGRQPDAVIACIGGGSNAIGCSTRIFRWMASN